MHEFAFAPMHTQAHELTELLMRTFTPLRALTHPFVGTAHNILTQVGLARPLAFSSGSANGPNRTKMPKAGVGGML